MAREHSGLLSFVTKRNLKLGENVAYKVMHKSLCFAFWKYLLSRVMKVESYPLKRSNPEKINYLLLYKVELGDIIKMRRQERIINVCGPSK